MYLRAWERINIKLQIGFIFLHKIETEKKLCLRVVSLLHKLETEKKLCLRLVSFLHKLEKKKNYAWDK